MALPVTIPNTFANATASIPLSQLDTNFTTLANAVNGISDGSETLANASVTVLTAGTVDINGGAIDGTTVGTSNAAAGSFTTLNTSGAVVFNDAGADVDFRVEGDTDANLLFVDAGADKVGVGTNTPFAKLQVVAASADYFNPQVMIGEASNSTGKQLHVGYNTTANTGYIQAVHNGTGYKDLLLQPNGGNVGIGVTPSAWTSTFKALQVKQGSISADNSSNTTFANNCYFDGSNWKYINSAAAQQYLQFSGQHIWTTAASGTAGNNISFTSAMTLNASGNLLVGTTSATGSRIDVNGNNGIYIKGWGSGIGTGMILDTTVASTSDAISFAYNGTQVGKIQTTSTSTAYVTSSDYRLKENVAPMTGALAKVLELNPVTYTWKADGSAGEGFIAHELQEVAPYAVSGEKDGEEMQGVDYGKITPLLTAALQEAITEIQSLKARVAELEAK